MWEKSCSIVLIIKNPEPEQKIVFAVHVPPKCHVTVAPDFKMQLKKDLNSNKYFNHFSGGVSKIFLMCLFCCVSPEKH